MMTIEQELANLGLEVYSQNFSAKRLVTMDTKVVYIMSPCLLTNETLCLGCCSPRTKCVWSIEGGEG